MNLNAMPKIETLPVLKGQDMIVIGHGIKVLRKQRGIRQGAVADACNVSQSNVSHWEKTGRVPTEYFPTLVQLFDVTVDELEAAGATANDALPLRQVNGLALRILREQLGVTQVTIAEAVGVYPSTVSYWERSGILPEEHLDDVTTALGVTVREFHAKAAELLAAQPVDNEDMVATWRDAVMLDNTLPNLEKLLLATWSYFWVDAIKAVSVTPQRLMQKIGWSEGDLDSVWATALMTSYVEKLDESGSLLRLKFPN